MGGNMNKVSLLVVGVLILLGRTDGIGLLTQLTVSYRAHIYFNGTGTGSLNYNKLLTDNYEALRAGSVFPDAFYNCAGGEYRHIAEDTHTGGFLNASINYIREQYPRPWHRHAQQTVAFLFGVLSSQVASSLSDGNGADQSIAQTLAKLNYHGNTTDSQKALDLGADSVILYKSDVSQYVDPGDSWYVPVKDLFNIYKDYYGSVKVSKNVIENCTTLQTLEEILETYLVALMYPEVAAVSPFLVDDLEDHFTGGLNDMAKWTNVQWQNMFTMMENGTKACTIPENSLFIHCGSLGPGHPDSHTVGRRQRNSRRSSVKDVNLDDMILTRTEHGTRMTPSVDLKRRLNRLSKNKKTPHKVTERGRETSYLSAHQFSQAGRALATGDVNGDGNEDLVVGAPGFSDVNDYEVGKVYLIFQNDTGFPMGRYSWDVIDIDNATIINVTLVGPGNKHSRFGASVALLDINEDGHLDLAVGAPAFGNKDELDYNGVVYIYFSIGTGKPVSDQPNITITCQSQFCNLGFSMAVIDINKDGKKDLALGSPYYSVSGNQSGIVSGILASASYKGTITVTFESLVQKWSLPSKQAYSWFGYSLKAAHGYLLVSQPYYRHCASPDCKFSPKDLQGVGAMNVFNIENVINPPGFVYTGLVQYDFAGASADIGYPYGKDTPVFAVGVPGANVYAKWSGLPAVHLKQAGTVLLYKLGSDGGFQQIANFDGDSPFARFGQLVKFADVNSDGVDDLIISSVERSDGLIILPDDDPNGETYVVYGGTYFPVGNETYTRCHEDEISPCMQKVANVTYSGTYSMFGRNAVVMKAKKVVSTVMSIDKWNNVYLGEGSGIQAHMEPLNGTTT